MVVNIVSDLTFVYPTDTVWGIGGSIESQESAKTIQRVKNTSEEKPVSVMFKSIDQLKDYINLPSTLSDLWLTRFFELETTLALPISLLKKRVGKWITADSDLIAVRCLQYPSIVSIIDRVGSPITTTSFNLTGTPPLTSKEDVLTLLGEVNEKLEFIDDASAFLSGNSSSILAMSTDGTFSFLRKGRLASDVERHCSFLSA